MLLHRLDLKGICVSTGSACDSKNTQISHVLKAMNVPVEFAEGTIRISLSKDNSLEEVEAIANALVSILA
jgi:cysteine desulfurase